MIGYGITSDPIPDISASALIGPVRLAIKEPWRAMDVSEAACHVQDCDGYILRTMKLPHGEHAMERITFVEDGMVTYNKCDSDFNPGEVERVLRVLDPPGLELYQRSACTGRRLDWRVPAGRARDTFSNLGKLAKLLEMVVRGDGHHSLLVAEGPPEALLY